MQQVMPRVPVRSSGPIYPTITRSEMEMRTQIPEEVAGCDRPADRPTGGLSAYARIRLALLRSRTTARGFTQEDLGCCGSLQAGDALHAQKHYLSHTQRNKGPTQEK